MTDRLQNTRPKCPKNGAGLGFGTLGTPFFNSRAYAGEKNPLAYRNHPVWLIEWERPVPSVPAQTAATAKDDEPNNTETHMKKIRPIKLVRQVHQPGCPEDDEGLRPCPCKPRLALADLTPAILADLKRQARSGKYIYLFTTMAAQIIRDSSPMSARTREEIFGGVL